MRSLVVNRRRIMLHLTFPRGYSIKANPRIRSASLEIPYALDLVAQLGHPVSAISYELIRLQAVSASRWYHDGFNRPELVTGWLFFLQAKDYR